MNKTVSIIVPVYNVKPYLSRCLDSILNQSYTDIEVILIDDGSTDGSRLICEKYAVDQRVKIFHQKNSGQSVARNLGLDNINGEYILFVDADDYIHHDLLALAVKNLEDNNADVVVFEHYEITADGIVPFQNQFIKEGITSVNIDTKKIVDFIMMDAILNVLWNKLYRKSLWDKIRLPEGYVYEDLYIHPQLFLRVNKATFLPQRLYYNNRVNPMSTTSSEGDWNSFNRYCKFRAYREHERVAQAMQREADSDWAVFKASREAIKAFCINLTSHKRLKEEEIADLKDYLEKQWSPRLASALGCKYSFLHWSVLHAPFICRLYSKIREKQDKLKRWDKW